MLPATGGPGMPPLARRNTWRDIPASVEALRQFWMPIRFKRGAYASKPNGVALSYRFLPPIRRTWSNDDLWRGVLGLGNTLVADHGGA